MSQSRPELHALLGAYLLDALDEEERGLFEEHLSKCGACAGEVVGLRETTARLAAAVASAPPPGLRSRVMRAAASTRQLPPRLPPTARHLPAGSRHRLGRRALGHRRLLGRAALVVAGLAVGAAGAGGFALFGSGSGPQGGDMRERVLAAVLTASDSRMMSAPTSAGGTATVVMSRREHAIVFVAAGLPHLPSTKSYELMLMGRGHERSIGALPRAVHGMTGPVVSRGLRASDERLGVAVEARAAPGHPKMILLMRLSALRR